jgi:hypothetical protein
MTSILQEIIAATIFSFVDVIKKKKARFFPCSGEPDHENHFFLGGIP